MGLRILFVIFAIVLGILSTPRRSLAEDLRGFWQNDIARDWDLRPKSNSSKDLQFRDLPKGAAKGDKLEPAPELVNVSAKPEPEKQKEEATPKSREEILSKYGDPKIVEPVVPKSEEASPAFRGMAAALAIGDKDLAFQYARSHVKHMKEFQDFVGKSTEYQMLAMEAEGMRPAPDEEDPNFSMSSERNELKDALAKAKADRAKELAAQEFDAKAQQLLTEEELAQKQGISSVNTKPKIDLEEIPIDPQGKVQVLFFFSPQDSSTKEAMPEIVKLVDKFKDDPRVEITGLTEERLSLIQIEIIRKTLNLPFQIRNGDTLIEKMKITEMPSVVMVAPTTRKTYRLTGVSKVDELEKVIRLMQGGK